MLDWIKDHPTKTMKISIGALVFGLFVIVFPARHQGAFNDAYEKLEDRVVVAESIEVERACYSSGSVRMHFTAENQLGTRGDEYVASYSTDSERLSVFDSSDRSYSILNCDAIGAEDLSSTVYNPLGGRNIFGALIMVAGASGVGVVQYQKKEKKPRKPSNNDGESSSSNPYKNLENLKDLYDKGIISEEEFKQKKKNLMEKI